jgi:hypothetical protein
MEDTTQHDQDETDPAPGQDEEGNLEFDPEQIENDPAQNPPVEHLKDLKGG